VGLVFGIEVDLMCLKVLGDFVSKAGGSLVISIADGLQKIRSVGSVGTEDIMCHQWIAEHTNESREVLSLPAI
jgi:hypothetical protein